jgi:hypothetical protein
MDTRIRTRLISLVQMWPDTYVWDIDGWGLEQEEAAFSCSYCGEDTTECRQAARHGGPCGA